MFFYFLLTQCLLFQVKHIWLKDVPSFPQGNTFCIFRVSRCVMCVYVCVLCRLVEAGSGSVQSLSLSDSHLAELDGDTLRLFGLGALEALERGWGVQTAGAVIVITFRYINFDAIVPTLPRIRVKFPNLSVRAPTTYCNKPWHHFNKHFLKKKKKIRI